MLLRCERVIALRPKAMTLDVLFLILAVGYFIERQVGNFCQRVVERLGGLFLVYLHRRDRFLQRGDLTQQSLGFLLVLILFRLADFLRRRIAPRLGSFEREDFCAALLVERDQPLRLRRKPAPRQRFVESVRIVANESDVVHQSLLRESGRPYSIPTASCAGLTRASILPCRPMDCRIKSGNDERERPYSAGLAAAAAAAARSAAARFSTTFTDQTEPS